MARIALARIALPSPRKWDELMSSIPGPPIEGASNLIKSIIDYILDNTKGAVPGNLRAEIVMQKELFEDEYDEYELFVWTFSERFEPGEFEYRLAEAVAAAGRPGRQGDIDIIAKAVMMMIHEKVALQSFDGSARVVYDEDVSLAPSSVVP